MAPEKDEDMIRFPETPQPQRKATAIEEALKRFDEENSDRVQGSDEAPRLKHRMAPTTPPSRKGLKMHSTTYSTPPKRSALHRQPLIAACAMLLVAGAGSWLYWHDPSLRDPLAQRETVSPDEDAGTAKPELEGKAPPAAPEPKASAETDLAASEPQPTPPPIANGVYDRGLPGEARGFAVPQAAPSAEGYAQSYAPRTRALLPDQIINSAEPFGRDKFDGEPESGFQITADDPVSTFSIDVDTASYSFVRSSLDRNVLPQRDAVRTEELINYFDYGYAPPKSAEEPFATDVAIFPSPWAEGRKLIRIGIQGYEIAGTARPRANLVFLVDTSGSMQGQDRLPLLKQSLSMLVDELRPEDKVAIVTYAGSAGTVLEPTSAKDKSKILAALDQLASGGATAGGEGIRQAYSLAQRNFEKDGVNRVILATDGDFNVGITNQDELKGFIERERDKGIFLSVLGFGRGNYNDALMQALAQNGNGAAAYIDTMNEARKVLVDEASSTLFPIAKDVKIQVEFNPQTVAEYRLIGYETRALAREDFNNDQVDAGEVGSGQAVTALYEIVPAGGPRLNEPLRYGDAESTKPTDDEAGEYGFLKLRYKRPDADRSKLMETPIDRGAEVESFEAAPESARFATAVAGFGQLLRGGKYTGTFGYDDVLKIANGAKGRDEYGYRSEFTRLVRAAKTAKALPEQR
ncbi:von Willebrand factor [Methyloligella halotolerans]|uniref:von Willebrand factor n=1 Tax=Methyloligella halotolerans TaxID=1177755 RepID=A0A1E2S0X5_9HYPH|nr:VWA domain-containing protein [Methyloligella halotolerans]ODA67975.1 von Willebrand factor [Methyloligella halotolerans]